jgi:hypothetical protein
MDETEKAIRELCRPYMDVDGDSDGVPGIEDLVERVIAALTADKEER